MTTAFVDSLSELFSDTISRQAFASFGAYGEPSHSASVSTYKARIVKKNKMVRNSQGHEVLATAQAWIQGNPIIGLNDKITLSDGSVPIIVSTDRFQDETGYSHTVVYFL